MTLRLFAWQRVSTAFLLPFLAMLCAIHASAQTPALGNISPSSAPAGQNSLTITVTGANFTAGSVLFWNNSPLSTSVLSSTLAIATVPASLMTSPGSVFIRLSNNITSSNVLTFTLLSALSVVSRAPANAILGVSYSYSFTASGGALPYFWAPLTALPPGMTLSTSGVLSGIPASLGSFAFDVQVTDNSGTSRTGSATLTVVPPPVAVTTSTLALATTGVFYSQTLTASGGTPPYTWAASGLPLGISIDSRTGTLSGTPAARGGYSINVQATDSIGTVGSKQLTLTVNVPPLSISTNSPLFDATVGVSYAQTFTADGGVPPYNWSIASGSAGELTLDRAKGVLSGTPVTVGTYSFQLQVTDSAGGLASKSFVVNVALPKLTITTAAALPNARVAVPYSVVLAVTGGVAPYTWTSVDANLPAGLTVDAASGTISGTPAAPGTATFSIQVTDGAQQNTRKTFTITTSPAPLNVVSATLPNAAVGQPFSFTATASGGVSPFTWGATGLPDGLQIDATTGQITGTPTTPGTFSFNVRVTDAVRATAAALFQLRIVAPALPVPSFTGVPSTMDPASQTGVSFELDRAYTTDLSGQITLTFAPDSGPGDGTIQFSTGRRSVAFTIPSGSTKAVLPAGLAIQSGTVAGNIVLSASLQAFGADVTPSPAPSWTIRVNAAAPVIQGVKVSSISGGLQVQITGYATSREISQAKFDFSATSGSTLANSSFTVPLDQIAAPWFADVSHAQYGSQFTITQAFTIQGNAGAVQLRSVTLSNRLGDKIFQVSQ